MADLLKIGLTGIQTSQAALSTTGHNITSANVPGYSRQRTDMVTNVAQGTPDGFIGGGSRVETITRLADQFATEQLRRDNTAYHRLDTINGLVSQLDTIFANPNTGISTALNSFFASVQTAADDPSSAAARQLVLSQSDNLVQRFQTLYQRIEDQRAALGSQIQNMVGEISQIGANIANLNKSIEIATGQAAGNPPNDLMDQRDELLRRLSELVGVQVIPTENNKVNVSIGNGQPLVLGIGSNQVLALDSELDPSVQDIAFKTGNVTLRYDASTMSGGKLGGLLEFRDEILTPAFNELGRLALTFADSFNQQHAMGMDLDGDIGNRFFEDINTAERMALRVRSDSNNALPDDRVLGVEITDVSQLTASDYELRFDGPANTDYSIIRLKDNATVNSGTLSGTWPESVINVDGMSIHFTSGSFQQGDRFLLQPTRKGAENVARELDSTRDIALAYPVRTETARLNRGTGAVSQGEMLAVFQPDANELHPDFVTAMAGAGITLATGDTNLLDTFATPGALSPPVTIRFTSATTYDILDNSDPANPVDFDPPLRNLSFTPGAKNAVFSTDPLATGVTADGASVGTFLTGAIGTTTNGYAAEDITITTTDPRTGVATLQTLSLPANQSAAATAAQLSALAGVEATANTEVGLTLSDDGSGSPVEITLNGIDLTDATIGAVPDPITVDFLRDRINQSAQLKALGITARSDGTTLTVRSVRGDDLSFDMVGGDAGTDRMTVTRINGLATGGNIDVGDGATIGGTVDVRLDAGAVLTSTGGLFSNNPVQKSIFTGYQVVLDGKPVAGDEFRVGYNTNGSTDNRNAFSAAGLQNTGTGSGGMNYGEMYGQLVEFVGAKTSETRINAEAALALRDQSQSTRDSISGVNLDEEAARLIQFEQAYSAAAQVISTARQLFDALLTATR